MSRAETVVARLKAFENGLLTGMAYTCGALFLLLAVYTALDVVGRRYFGLFSGVTDEVSGYILALGGSWAFAYALKAGGHVRVDILLAAISGRVRNALDVGAMIIMAIFAGTVSVFVWKLVASSYTVGATGHSIIQTPQWVPQALMALGYSVLALVALSEAIGRLLAPRLYAEEHAAPPLDDTQP